MGRSCCADNFLPHVRFLILLTVFELLPKTCNFTICSIFSNSGHVGWCTASPDTILKLDTLVMIQTKFGFHWSSTFRGEDFWKGLQRTTDTFGSGELKRHVLFISLFENIDSTKFVLLSIFSNKLIKRTCLFSLYINLMFDVNTFLHRIFVTCLELLAISKYQKPLWYKETKRGFNNGNVCLNYNH